jgi:MFS family permease
MTRHGVLLIGISIALLNAMLRPVMSGNWHPNYLIMAVLASAIWQVVGARNPDQYRNSDVVLLIGLLVSLLMPSSQWAWISLGVFCLVHFRFGGWSRGTSIVLLVLAAAAFREPVGHFIKEWLAEDLLQFDTGLVEALLVLQGAEVVQSGNILRLANDHALVVLTGCGSFTNISVALLVWYGACMMQVGGWRSRFIWSGLVVAVLTLFVNVLRLALLAQGPGWFTFFHDGAGVWVMQTLGFAAIALPILVQVKYEKAGFDRRDGGLGSAGTVA